MHLFRWKFRVEVCNRPFFFLKSHYCPLLTESNNDQSYLLPKHFHLLLKEFWLFLPSLTEIHKKKCFLTKKIVKEFWPIPHASEGILTNITSSRKDSNQPRPLLKDFWPISLVLKRILTNPTCSRGNLDWSCPLLNEFWWILRALRGILTTSSASGGIPTKFTCSQRNSVKCLHLWQNYDQSHLLLKV